MEPWSGVYGSASVKSIAVIEIAAVVIEIVVVEVVAIDDCAAVRNVGVVVVFRAMAVPVIIPVMPAPSKATKKANPQSASEEN
jgi:hypothetical protein